MTTKDILRGIFETVFSGAGLYILFLILAAIFS